MPARVLRSVIEHLEDGPPLFTPRQQVQHDRVIARGRSLMAMVGAHNVTFGGFALGLRLSPATLRWHFCDMSALLAFIIRTHLARLEDALRDIPRTEPDCLPRRRAAYLALTRLPNGCCTEDHTLLVRDLALLPEDEMKRIEPSLQVLDALLGTPGRPTARVLLDRNTRLAQHIETILPCADPEADAPDMPDDPPDRATEKALREAAECAPAMADIDTQGDSFDAAADVGSVPAPVGATTPAHVTASTPAPAARCPADAPVADVAASFVAEQERSPRDPPPDKPPRFHPRPHGRWR